MGAIVSLTRLTLQLCMPLCIVNRAMAEGGPTQHMWASKLAIAAAYVEYTKHRCPAHDQSETTVYAPVQPSSSPSPRAKATMASTKNYTRDHVWVDLAADGTGASSSQSKCVDSPLTLARNCWRHVPFRQEHYRQRGAGALIQRESRRQSAAGDLIAVIEGTMGSEEVNAPIKAELQ